jgi:hypothetical protein
MNLNDKQAAAKLVPGAVFDTIYEAGCKVADDPDWSEAGRFFTAYRPGGKTPFRFDIIDVTQVHTAEAEQAPTQAEFDAWGDAGEALIKALRQVKQDEFNSAVEGNAKQPADVVDSVVYAIQDHLPADVRAKLYPEVLNFYPDYTG